MKAASENRTGERGQTLVLGLLALIILTIATLFLFDFQSIIRLKIKTQTATDAAALAAANWQKNSLNMIGELNIIKATTMLISDVYPPKEVTADFLLSSADLQTVQTASDILTEMQSRISFVGPLLGFGAAQQAAKNNRLNYNEAYGRRLATHYVYLNDDSYYGSDMINQMIPARTADPVTGEYRHAYWWRTPYTNMIHELADMNDVGNSAKGVAVMTNAEFMGLPVLNSTATEFLGYLSNPMTYEAINANYWCYIRELIRMDFGTKWWGDITLETNTAFFPQESEYLTLHIDFSQGSSAYTDISGPDASNPAILDETGRIDDSKLFRKNYDTEDPYICDSDGNKTIFTYDNLTYKPDTSNPASSASGATIYPIVNITTGVALKNADGTQAYTRDSDRYWNPLPYITWAIYDTTPRIDGKKWLEDDTYIAKWDMYRNYDMENWDNEWMEHPVRSEYRYVSGAVARVTASATPFSIISSYGLKNGESGSGSYLGDSLGGTGSASMNTYAAGIKSTEGSLRASLPRVKTTSQAKAFGCLNSSSGKIPPNSVRMILPVFTKTAIIPSASNDMQHDTPLNMPFPDSPPYDNLSDPNWFYFVTEYMPTLGTVDDIDEMESLMSSRYPEHWSAGIFAPYHAALLKLNSAAWRQTGIDWLEAEYTGHDVYDSEGKVIDHITDVTNEEMCDYWTGTGPGVRQGPTSLH